MSQTHNSLLLLLQEEGREKVSLLLFSLILGLQGWGLWWTAEKWDGKWDLGWETQVPPYSALVPPEFCFRFGIEVKICCGSSPLNCRTEITESRWFLWPGFWISLPKHPWFTQVGYSQWDQPPEEHFSLQAWSYFTLPHFGAWTGHVGGNRSSGGWWAAKMSPPLIAGGSQRTARSQGQPFIPVASLKKERAMHLCDSNFVFLLFLLFLLFFSCFGSSSPSSLTNRALGEFFGSVWWGLSLFSLLLARSMPLPCSLTSAEMKFLLMVIL